MGGTGEPNAHTIPAFMVDPVLYGAALKAADGQTVTLPQPGTYQAIGGNDVIADFISRGLAEVDDRIKPDAMAPGVNLVPSVPRCCCGGAPGFAFFNGTWVASPHLAGSAAIVRQRHPDWTAAQVRSPIVNTADQGVV